MPGVTDQLRLGRRRRSDASYPHDPRWIAWNRWRATCPRRAEGRWPLCWLGARMMRALGSRASAGAEARRSGCGQATDHHPASDLARGNFISERPNTLWVGKISSQPTLAGFLHLTLAVHADLPFRGCAAFLDDGFGVTRSSSSGFLLCRFGGFRRAVFEAEAVVSGFEDVATVGEAVEQRRRHLRRRRTRSPTRRS